MFGASISTSSALSQIKDLINLSKTRLLLAVTVLMKLHIKLRKNPSEQSIPNDITYV